MYDNNLKLTIGWLYPDLMSTYGDRGNVICLTKRCQWRGIEVKVEEISLNTKYQILNTCDFLFMGGAQDRQQKIVSLDLFNNKGPALKKMINSGVPGLFICGAYQFMGNYYQPAEGEKIPGLGVFDLYTVHSGFDKKRCVGNIVVNCHSERSEESLNLFEPAFAGDSSPTAQNDNYLIGFENHGGKTYLGTLGNLGPLGTVIKGYGNNGRDKTEGCLYKNAIGTYLHGPILPKNPQLADWFIKTALEKKYQEAVKLKKLDDSLEWQAHNIMVSRILRR